MNASCEHPVPPSVRPSVTYQRRNRLSYFHETRHRLYLLKVSSKGEFHENLRSKSHTLLRGANKFLTALSKVVSRFTWNSVSSDLRIKLLAINEFQETQLGMYRETIRNFDSKELPGEVCLLRHEMRHWQSCLICTFQMYSWYHASNNNNNNKLQCCGIKQYTQTEKLQQIGQI